MLIWGRSASRRILCAIFNAHRRIYPIYESSVSVLCLGRLDWETSNYLTIFLLLFNFIILSILWTGIQLLVLVGSRPTLWEGDSMLSTGLSDPSIIMSSLRYTLGSWFIEMSIISCKCMTVFGIILAAHLQVHYYYHSFQGGFYTPPSKMYNLWIELHRVNNIYRIMEAHTTNFELVGIKLLW